LYTVQAGDTVSGIAKRFNTTPNVIRELNELPSGPLVIGTELRVPASEVKLPPKVALAAARVDGRDRAARPHVHVVRKGDSLWRIARRHGMNVNTLAMINGMQPTDTIRAGQKLRLTPAAGSAKTTKTSSGTTTAAVSGDGRDVTYVVRRGDTLSAIARIFQVTVAELVSWNDISVNTPIKPGQKLMIRVAGSRS
ncbi:MAG TPA: LysM peptidoglycan-binding domain-containing protein, partial [Steroidobacteraceae bacterium]